MRGFELLFPRTRLSTAILVTVVCLAFVQIVLWSKSAEKSRSLQWFENIQPRIRSHTEIKNAGNTSHEREMPISRQRSTPRDVCFSISHSKGEEINVSKPCPFVVVFNPLAG